MLQARARTVVREPTFVLVSPYEAEATSPYADVVRKQAQLVRNLFVDTLEEPLRLYLLPIPTARASEPWMPVGQDGVAGGAFDEGFAFVYVSASAGEHDSMTRAWMNQDDVRHEIAHLCARRCGLQRARWFHEGMAREIESMCVDASALVSNPFPPALLDARDQARSGTIAELLRWPRHDTLDGATRERLYAEAQALFRYLCERQPDGDWIARARAVHDMDDAQVLALEPEWLAWLERIDVIAAIRRGTQSASAAQRQEAASLLPILAEHGRKDVFTRAADELALELLAGSDTSTYAATFLLFFRARQLSKADVEKLAASSEPGFSLTAEALHARRGEAVDRERARSAWSRLSAQDRTCFEVAAVLLPDIEKL